MKFAVRNDRREEASPKAVGFCPVCDAKLIAKCGNKKVWHWAHKGQRHCDQWWESESEWHRSWKNYFPQAWQEVALRSVDGTKHIADIMTPQGRVIEFQHSPISEEEQHAREVFYGNMIWVVDGTRLKRDRSTFLSHIAFHMGISKSDQNVEFNPLVPSVTKRWNSSAKPVYLDFHEDGLWKISAGMKGNWQKRASKIDKHEFLDAILKQAGVS